MSIANNGRNGMNSTGKDWTIVGVDCSTRPEKVGLARGLLRRDGGLSVSRATLGSAVDSPAISIARWLDASEHFLIAMDAPLGWPAPLADVLSAHRAGQPLPGEADRLFRRAIDEFVHTELKKRPLDVGADRIARTAKWALSLLQQVRERLKLPIPLVWIPGEESGVIEVYPAATLKSRGILATGYKDKQAEDKRRRIFERLQEEIEAGDMPSEEIERVTNRDDLLDGVVCVLAGADFVRGETFRPQDCAKARREGWIWFRGRRAPELWSNTGE